MSGPTKAIRRALDTISAHGRVQNVRAIGEEGRKVAVDFVVPMPSRWVGAGESPSGVRPLETVTFTFGEAFPLQVPLVELRQDFDRAHPHLQPVPATEPPQPCYFEGNPLDLLRYQGVHGIVSQVADWLEKAAAADLMNFNQGWEPVRRDSLDDWVELDADFVRSLVNRDGGFAYSVSQHLQVPLVKGGHAYAISVNARRDGIGKAIFDKVIASAKGVGFCAVVWAGKNDVGKPTVSDKYLPETVGCMPELIERASQFGLLEQLRGAFAILRSRFQGKHYKIPLILTLLLVVRRPTNVIGQGSPLEIIPYVLEVTGASDLGDSSKTLLRPAMIHDAIGPKLLASVSGSRRLDNALWSLIGCGSVGSKLAIHLAREGRAPTTLVDRSLMSPHNYARHALLPMRQYPVPNSKASLLAAAIDGFDQSAKPLHEDLLALVAPPAADAAKIWPKGTQFLLDATGSPSVTDALCLAGIQDARPRTIETSLLARGSIGFMAVEGPHANPSVQDLQGEFYRLVGSDEALHTAVFSAAGNVISIGQGCSTKTAQMTDARLSAFVPGMAHYVSRALEDGLPSQDGELVIGHLADDLMGQSWQRSYVPPFRRMRTASCTRISISDRVVGMVDIAIGERPGVETGGVLIGRYNEATDSFHVVDLLEPPSDSRFTAAEFTLGVAGLRDEIQSYCERVRGAVYPVGTWHNHLVDSPASLTDLATAAALALGQNFPVILLIRTPELIRGVVADAVRGTADKSVQIEPFAEVGA